MATVTKTDNLKMAKCSPSDGVNVMDTKMLRGQPDATTPAWSDTNKTEQHVANDSANGEGGGGKNNLKG